MPPSCGCRPSHPYQPPKSPKRFTPGGRPAHGGVRIRGAGTKSGLLWLTEPRYPRRGTLRYFDLRAAGPVRAGRRRDATTGPVGIRRDDYGCRLSPWPTATIGGIISSNFNAPLRMRYGYGSLRDQVLRLPRFSPMVTHSHRSPTGQKRGRLRSGKGVFRRPRHPGTDHRRDPEIDTRAHSVCHADISVDDVTGHAWAFVCCAPVSSPRLALVRAAATWRVSKRPLP